MTDPVTCPFDKKKCIERPCPLWETAVVGIRPGNKPATEERCGFIDMVRNRRR